VAVPLDRSRADGTTIPISFVILPRTKPAEPAQEPIFVILGGPGIAASPHTDTAVRNFAAVRATHDIVVIDYRGEGRSGAINCSPLQHLSTNSNNAVLRAVGTCGTELGDASDRYGAGDIADDIDAIRAALGYSTIDLYGVSYGTVHAQAYALRHREHVRELILDGAIDPLLGPARSWSIGVSNAVAVARDVALVCSRSPSCSRANPHPAQAFAALARQLRRHPVDGVGRDISGVSQREHINEADLVRITSATEPFYISDGELVAAAAALGAGDKAPLLRIAANTPGPLWGDGGDPAEFSFGLNAAASCTDLTVPWDRSTPFARRRAQLEAAVQRLSFGPFSADAWTNGGGFPNFCLRWPAPNDLQPPFTPQTRMPDVPVLVIAATLDVSTPLEQNQAVAHEFPHARLVVLRNAGHPPGVYAGCVPGIYAHFIRTLQAGDTHCVLRDDRDRPAVGVFARRIADAPPAARLGGDHATDGERRIATIAWMTVEDALRESARLPNMERGHGAGLRGGGFDETFDFDKGIQRLTLQRLRFSDDVAVDGHVTVDKQDLTAHVTVTTPQGRGRLTMKGPWFTFQTSAGLIRIHGQLDGHPVALSTPGG
jgi:pimeloyl-ACP methyl ester carboxylesterase